MSERTELNVELLNNVAGGVTRKVQNDSVDYANIRAQASINSKVFFTVKNGTDVTLTGNKITRDGYTWYEIYLAGAYEYGWIAGSLIGY